MAKQVLLIEDDPQAARFISAVLGEAGFAVQWIDNGAEGLRAARLGQHHCLVLDRQLEGIDGLGLLTLLRSEGKDLPVLILSAMASTDERVRGLRAGADDYLAKPFAPAELIARIEALLRRRSAEAALPGALSCGDLHMNVMTGMVTRGGMPVSLSPRSSQLLAFLLHHKDEVVTRRAILEQVWRYDFNPGTNVIDVHISNLRRSIDPPGLPRLLHTIRGIGYRLSENDRHASASRP